jgi:intein/homing endonuclease
MTKGFKGLFDIKKVATREQYENLVAKSQKLQKTKSTTQKGGSLIVKIKNICDQVQQRLGHYAQELQLTQTEEDLVRYIDKCIENGKIAIDTETTGLDAFTDKIVGVCIYTYNQKAAYIPINHISYITNFRIAEQLTEQQVAQQLQRLVEAKTEIIMFNAKFDVRVIRQQLNVYLTPSWCGFIAAKCLKNNEAEGNLKYLWKKYCSPDKEAEHFTFDKMFDGIRFDMIPLNTAYLYAAKDALMTMELYDFQKPYLTETDPKCIDLGFQKLAKLYNEIELPIIPIVADIEDTGVALDVEYCKQLSEKYNIKLKEAEEKFHKELENYKDQLISYINTHPQTKLEDPINIASPAQLAELFYDVLKQPSVSKKSPRGTGEEILEKMGHPLGKLILDYRGVAKLLNTYIDKMPAIVNTKTGRIHCSFNQYGTDCPHEDSHLVTDKGVFSLKELFSDICKENGTFYDVDLNILNKDLIWEKATKAIKYENVDTIKIKGLYGFEIEGTPNHPIIVSRINHKQWSKNHSQKQFREFWDGKYFKQLDQIEVGDYIEVPYKWEWPKVSLIRTNFKPTLLQTHKNRDLKIPEYYNELLAEFLGIYHADGYVTNGQNGSFCVRISNKDPDVFERLKYLCLELFNVHPTIQDHGRIKGSKIINIILTHCQDLLNILSKGALNKRIPEQIRHSNKEVIKAYLRGMTLDSSRHTNKLWITVRNKSDAQFIQMFLCSQGILSSLRYEPYTYKNESKDMYRIALNATNLNLFLDLVGVVQSRKNIKEDKENIRYRHVKMGPSFRIKVESIERSKATVYDIHVPETHSFICNSMINHNTGRFSSSNPNLQNIPSHNKDIRPMFTSTLHKDIICEDRQFSLLYCDRVPTLYGKKYSQDLQIGDTLICDDGNHTITNIIIEQPYIKVYI